MRHLVDAFTSRAQAARHRIETPATPSSVSSRETVEAPPPTVNKQTPQQETEKAIARKDEEQPSVQTTIETRGFLQKIGEIYEDKVIDPNGKTYLVWMSVAALAVLYNAWVIPLRSTFPYQTPNNRAVWMTFDYIADFIYVVDVFVMQPRIMYLHEGFWIREMCLTRQNYFQKKAFKVKHLFFVFLLPTQFLFSVRSSIAITFGPPLHTFRTGLRYTPLAALFKNEHILGLLQLCRQTPSVTLHHPHF